VIRPKQPQLSYRCEWSTGRRSRPAPPIEIVLPTGPTVRVPAGFDPRTLGHVLAVLEGRPC